MPTVDAGFHQRELVRYGPTLAVRIGYDVNYRPGRQPEIPATLYPALIDTGATVGGIDSTLAESLDLPIVDEREVSGVGGVALFKIHSVQIYIPDLNHVFHGRFAGVHLAAGNLMHRALLGRTFLQYCAMRYDGRTGSVEVCNDPLS